MIGSSFRTFLLSAVLILFASGCNFSFFSDSGVETKPHEIKPPESVLVEKKPENSEIFSYAECVKAENIPEGKFPARRCTANGVVFFEQSDVSIVEKHLACESDADCMPIPGCHPRSCVNAEFSGEYGEVPEMCTMMFDCSAAYSAKDCLCVNGFCTNKNADGSGCGDVATKSDCSDEEDLVCGEKSFCECGGDSAGSDSAVSITPIDGDKPCMGGCKKITHRQTYINKCKLKESGSVLISENECLEE